MHDPSRSPHLEDLKHRYALTDMDYEEALADIIAFFTKGKSPSPTPVATILGAQPGAGKTQLQKEAELRLSRNTVICNADNFRDFHPLAKEIKKKHPEEYPEITSEYAHRWNDALCLHCRTEKLNYILETTFSSGDRLNETIKEIKRSGYRVEIMLLAVSPKLSLLGTYMRYEDNLAKTGTGRKVAKEAHELRFKAIPSTIKAIQREKLYDDIYLYTRSVALDNSTQTEGISLITHNPANLLETYLEEAKRPWPSSMLQYYNDKRVQIERLMTIRNAPADEIEKFKKQTMLRKPEKRSRRRIFRR